MSYAIAQGWDHKTKARDGYVSITVYGEREAKTLDEPEKIGAALGLLYKAADAAFAIDPFGRTKVRSKFDHTAGVEGYKPKPYMYLLITFIASSDDVVTGGPLHRERARRCGAAMYRVVEEGRKDFP